MERGLNSMKKFSVLMSLYYKENSEWLKESVESVVNQKLMPNEIVIVKDGKLTESLENVLNQLYNKYPDLIKIHGYEENKGLGLALNYGIGKCQYDIIARMDTDDIADYNRFYEQMKLFEKDESLDIVGSNTIEFSDNVNTIVSKRFMPETDEAIKKYSRTRCPFVHPSVMFKKSKIIEAGNYQHCYLCEDYDMWFRALNCNAKCYNIQQNLVYMRVNKNFYKRRGGWKYFKSISSFKRKMYEQKYMSRREYLKTYWASAIVCMAPGFVRNFIYKKLLRG